MKKYVMRIAFFALVLFSATSLQAVVVVDHDDLDCTIRQYVPDEDPIDPYGSDHKPVIRQQIPDEDPIAPYGSDNKPIIRQQIPDEDPIYKP